MLTRHKYLPLIGSFVSNKNISPKSWIETYWFFFPSGECLSLCIFMGQSGIRYLLRMCPGVKFLPRTKFILMKNELYKGIFNFFILLQELLRTTLRNIIACQQIKVKRRMMMLNIHFFISKLKSCLWVSLVLSSSLVFWKVSPLKVL